MRAHPFTVLSAICALLVGCTGGFTPDLPATVPPKVLGPLRTEGTRIIGPDGQMIRFLGVNLQGMQISNDNGSDQPDGCDRGWRVPPPDAAENIAGWGFNAVRLTIAWANLEPRPPTRNDDGSVSHHWGEEYLEALDGVIESLRDEGLMVILDPAQNNWSSAFKESGPSGATIICQGWGMPAWLNPHAPGETLDQARCDFVANRAEPGVTQVPWEGLAAVWRMLGERYADEPAIVAADTINEPYFVRETCTGADFQGLFRTLGSAIRRSAPRWLLLFEYHPATNKALDLNFPPPFDNQVYELHAYGQGWSEAKLLLDFSWKQAMEWRMPLFLGEFSAFGATSPGGGLPNWQEETRQMLDYMKERGIGWTVFGYHGGLSLISRNGRARTVVIEALQEGF
jgi:cellulase (glycosyl hydrolase family 5)